MISIFPFWTFQLYVVTCQQHMHKKYISLSWSDIPKLVVPMYHDWSHHVESFTVAIMTWLTVTEYLCHKWHRVCSVCRNHKSVLSTFMTYHWGCNKSDTTGVMCGTGTAYRSGAPWFDPVFCGVSVIRSLGFYAVFCR
jgi:hypothetical protein